MKIENFKACPMRQVEYFGITISIPADHEYVVTSVYGGVYSFTYEPYYEFGIWVTYETEPFVIYAVGNCNNISDEDAADSLRHYPVGDTNEQ
jgi:hypothetical protein|nr:MAG TPA: hypothetical protein [Caudoviricetes sp.]